MLWQVQPAGTHVSRVFVSLCQVYYRIRMYVFTHALTSLLNPKCDGLSWYWHDANDLEPLRPLIRESRSMFKSRSETYLPLKRPLNKRQVAIDRYWSSFMDARYILKQICTIGQSKLKYFWEVTDSICIQSSKINNAPDFTFMNLAFFFPIGLKTNWSGEDEKSAGLITLINFIVEQSLSTSL